LFTNIFLIKEKLLDFYLMKDTSHLLQIIGGYGLTNKCQIHTHIMVTFAMETLLQEVKPVMEKHTGLKLSETYSYARIYKKGDVLHRHKDRYSCEISTTLNLGGDPWSIYLDPTGKQGQAGIKVDLNPGDMLIYSGCDLEHWREEFTGKDCGQVFLHYNKSSSKTAKENLYDKRPFLGLPAWYKGFKLPK